jgi:hypothetical protein
VCVAHLFSFLFCVVFLFCLSSFVRLCQKLSVSLECLLSVSLECLLSVSLECPFLIEIIRPCKCIPHVTKMATLTCY